jgi:hypothetical protein
MAFDVVRELHALENLSPYARRISEAAAKEIDRLRIENAELRACFSAATVDWTFSQVQKVIVDAKNYVTPKHD